MFSLMSLGERGIQPFWTASASSTWGPLSQHVGRRLALSQTLRSKGGGLDCIVGEGVYLFLAFRLVLVYTPGPSLFSSSSLSTLAAPAASLAASLAALSLLAHYGASGSRVE